MADKKELNLEETEKISGGMNPNSVSPEGWEKIMNGPHKNTIELKEPNLNNPDKPINIISTDKPIKVTPNNKIWIGENNE